MIENNDKITENKGNLNRNGRPKGAANKYTKELKDMILGALDQAGGVDYLAEQAEKSPAAFLSLVGKVLPMQVTGDGGGAIVVSWQK